MGKPNINMWLQWLVGLFLFFLPWQTTYIVREVVLHGVKWEYGTSNFYVTELLLLIISCSLIVFAFKSFDRRIILMNVQQRVWLLPMFIWMYICVAAYSVGDVQSWQHVRFLGEAVLVGVVIASSFIQLQTTLWFLVAGSVVPALLGFWQFITQSTVASSWLGLAAHEAVTAGSAVIASDTLGRWLRAYGSFSHPNVFGGYMLVSVICTSLLLFLYDRKVERMRIFIWCVFVIQTIALVTSVSRSALLGLLLWCGLVAGYCFTKRGVLSVQLRNNMVAVLGIVGCICALFGSIYVSLVHVRSQTQTILEQRSVSERVTGMGDAIQIIQNHPWFGVGEGVYTVALQQLYPNQPGWFYQPVHNTPLLIVAELGFFGVFFLGATMFYWFFCAHKKRKIGYVLLFLLPFLPALVFDHYWWSSYIGLVLFGVYMGVVYKVYTSFPQFIHQRG